MRQGASRDRCHLLERVGPKHFYRIQSANRHVSKLTIRIAREVDVIGDGSRVDHFDNIERWPRVKHHSLADILKC